MKQVQRGFTLIELVMVIVVLGVLAVVAIPKFVDLRTDARTAALAGVAGALSSAAAINYASRSANIANGNAVTNCSNVATSMQGGVPAEYSITAAAVAANASVSCTLSTVSTPVITTTFTAIGIL